MLKSEINVVCHKNKFQPNFQKIDNSFLCVFINDFVKKFRNYNTDEFIIAITGLKKFIPKENLVIKYLLEELKENNFTLEFEGNDESIKQVDISCRNKTKDKCYNFKYQIQNIPTIVELSSKTNIPPVGIIIMKIVGQIISKIKILYKAIVLDLDDTLLKGTVAEDGIFKINENMNSEQGASFIAFMQFVKTLAKELGIFITICTRNDPKMVESLLEEFNDNIFPLKNEIDYIIANNNHKSENIRIIAKQLSILPNSIVFIDDNQIVRDEVKCQLPEVFIPEWSNHNELVTQLIAGCIFERIELSINSQNRRKLYKIIQTERIHYSLPKLKVKEITDDQHLKSIQLYAKSNQFKFSRIDDNFKDDTKSICFEIIRENGENLGICSAISFSHTNDTFQINNWAISCKYFELGLEEFILLNIQRMANSNRIFIDHEDTGYNVKVSEMLAKYSNAFKKNDNKDRIEIIFTKEIIDTFNKNTNLGII